MKRIRLWIRPWVGAVLCAALILSVTPVAVAAPTAADDGSSSWSAWLLDLVAQLVPWVQEAPSAPSAVDRATTTIPSPGDMSSAGNPSCDPNDEASICADPDG